MNAMLIPAAAVALVLIAAAGSYNRFVRQRNLIRDSWSDVDTELRRRYDLIPNLVETVKGYAGHERKIMDAVAEARAAALASTGTPGQQARAENALVGTLRQLIAVGEAYPDLKASASFLALQRELANTEDRIQTARRFYNANVREFNRRVASIPSALVARMFGFVQAQFFEVDAAVRAVPAANFQA